MVDYGAARLRPPRYEDTDDPQTTIAADLGVERRVLIRLAKSQRWRLRKDRPPRELPAAMRLAMEAERALRAKTGGAAISGEARVEQARVEEEAGADASASSAAVIAERLQRAVEKELAAVEAMHASDGPYKPAPADAERTARTLASLTDTLHRVQRLRAPERQSTDYDDYDDMPRDMDEFRRALARRIDAFVRSRTGGGVSDRGEGSNSNSSPS